MPPDLNGVSRAQAQHGSVNTTSSSVQASPNLSRRTSSIMGPPPVPQNSSLPSSPRPPTSVTDGLGIMSGAGPIRHPRPLTAAELHLELEKEQESIVNRLTRELSALRAQTASVASTTSSTSDLFTTSTTIPPPHTDPYIYGHGSTNIIPTTARRHRSSSNLSSRSARSTREALASAAAASAGATSVSGVAAPRDRDPQTSHHSSSRPSIDIPRPELSRQNSTSGGVGTGGGGGGGGGVGVSGAISSSSAYRASTNSNATSPHWTSHHGYPYSHPRHSVSSTVSISGTNYADNAGTSGSTSNSNMYGRSPSASFSAAQAQARYEEVALQRAELDTVKRENEALKMRIRELERSLAEKNSSPTVPVAAAATANTADVKTTDSTPTISSNTTAIVSASAAVRHDKKDESANAG